LIDLKLEKEEEKKKKKKKVKEINEIIEMNQNFFLIVFEFLKQIYQKKERKGFE
jgi:lipopolysaccharide biosynthesis regulator YciM